MSVTVAKANLVEALRVLKQRWAVIKDRWDDEAAKRFEADYIAPLEAKIAACVKGLDHVGELSAKVRRDVADDLDGGGGLTGFGG